MSLEDKFLISDIVNSIGHPKFVLQNSLYSNNFVKNNTVHICCDISVSEPLMETTPENSLSEQMRQKMFSIYEAGINDSCTLEVGSRPFKVFSILLTNVIYFLDSKDTSYC